MIKRFLFFFACMLPLLINAQDFKGGIRAGIVASQVDGDSYEGFNKAGLTGSIFVSRKFSEHFSLQMEFAYIQKGSRKPLDDNNTFYAMRLGYVEVPLLLQWHVTSSIDIFGGPSYGLLVSSEEETEYGVYQGPAFEKNEVAARIGLSYKLSEQWRADIRYANSITTIRPAPYAYSQYFDKGQFNRYVEIGLGYSF